MKKRPTLRFAVLTVLLSVLLWGQAAAQTVQLNLRYNAVLNRYEVYALPSQSNAPLLWGNAQISLLVPASMPNNPLAITNATAIIWQNGDELYTPAAAPDSDFHSFITSGAPINFTAGEEVLLFHFTLGRCVAGLRLFNNGSDPVFNAAGMMMEDYSNSIVYAIPGLRGGQAYAGNYDNSGTACSNDGSCPAPTLEGAMAVRQNTATLRWTSNSTPAGNCWGLRLAASASAVAGTMDRHWCRPRYVTSITWGVSTLP